MYMQNDLGTYHPQEAGEPESLGDELPKEPEVIEKPLIASDSDAKHLIHCLTVIGQVEGHYVLSSQNKTTKYEHIIPALVAIEQDRSVEGLLVILNTVGGDVEAGLALAELIAGMLTPTVSLVVGGGHSIGVPLAVAPQLTMIAPSASMTIHPIRMSGTMIAAPQTYHYFSRLQERIVRFVVDNSAVSAETFTALMMSAKDMAADVGSVIYGEEAVERGLIGRIGGLSDALEALYGMIEKRRKAGASV
jgi:ATP-dependent protease ClpP protease subunit